MSLRRSDSGMQAVAISPDGHRILTTSGEQLHLWDGRPAPWYLSLSHIVSKTCREAAFSPDGSLLAVIDRVRRLLLLDGVSPDVEGCKLAATLESSWRKHGFVDAVARDLEQMQDLSEPERAAALRMLRGWPDANDVNRGVRSVAEEPTRPATAYQKALWQAEELHRFAR